MTCWSYCFPSLFILCASASITLADEPPAVVSPSLPAASSRIEIRRDVDLGGLSPLRPYERGKIPVVMIHGLWGYPQQWHPMIEAFESDPSLKDRFQFWTFTYSSGDSIPFSADALRQSLKVARQFFDPQGTDPSFERTVVVGHSLGGVLAKMMVQDSGTRLWQTVSDRSIDELVGPDNELRGIRQAFFYKRVPEIQRAVFIATPHKGSPVDRGYVRTLGVRICDRFRMSRQLRETLLAQNDPEFFLKSFRATTDKRRRAYFRTSTSEGDSRSGNRSLRSLSFDHCRLARSASPRCWRWIGSLRELSYRANGLRNDNSRVPPLSGQPRCDPGNEADPARAYRNHSRRGPSRVAYLRKNGTRARRLTFFSVCSTLGPQCPFAITRKTRRIGADQITWLPIFKVSLRGHERRTHACGRIRRKL